MSIEGITQYEHGVVMTRKKYDDLQELLQLQRADYERALAARDKAREDADYCHKRAQDAHERLTRAQEEIARLVGLCDRYQEQLAAVTVEKNRIVEISNGFARERDEIQAEYEARGKVIKKLRKRLKKLKH